MERLNVIVVSLALIVFIGAGSATAATQHTTSAGFCAAKKMSAVVCAAMKWLAPNAVAPPAEKPALPPNDNTLLHIPGSTQTYTLAQIRSLFVAADWWPQDHPPMPYVVAHGRGKAFACGHCHLPTGLGRPEDAATAGLPFAYIVEQIKAFRGGGRKSGIMHMEASHLSDADMKLAAKYFSTLRFTPWTKVVETETVPKTHIENYWLAPTKGAGSEPIGNRIILIPANVELTKLGDTRSGYIAYVPPGSIERGAAIAANGVGTAPACASCHGADLRGVGMIPPLAGRMPTYIVRELLKFQEGRRRGTATLPMQKEVAKLTLKDMIDVAAYASSLKP